MIENLRFVKTWRVLEQPSVPVSSSVTLGLVTTGPGGSSARWASVTTRQGALEGGGDNLRGQVEVVPQVLDTLVGEVPAEYTFLYLLFQISCLVPYE